MKTFDISTPAQGTKTPILKDEKRAVMRLEVKAGEALPSHSSPGPLSLLVFRGELEFSDDETNEKALLKPGQGVLLEKKTMHSVRAVKDTTCFVNALFA
jgi:quercetin dioxygenase-like cupin family protein